MNAAVLSAYAAWVLSSSSLVEVTVGVWDAETQTWFGCGTKHPMQERRAEIPGCMQVLERAPKGGWRSVELPLVVERNCCVNVVAGKQGEKLELSVGIKEEE